MSDAIVQRIDSLQDYRLKLGDFNGAIQQADYAIYSVLETVEEDIFRKYKTMEEWYGIIEEALRKAEDELEELYADEDADNYEIALCEEHVNDLMLRRDKMGELCNEASNHLAQAKSDIEELESITRHQSAYLCSSVEQGIDFLGKIYIYLQDYKQKKSPQ